MVTIPPAKKKSQRQNIRPATFGAPPVALTLVSASYDHAALTLTMVFSRAIDISGMDGTQIEVDDGTFTHGDYFATGDATLLDAVTVRIGLVRFTSETVAGVRLSASECGIVAVDDGTQWEGVSALGLPFP